MSRRVWAIVLLVLGGISLLASAQVDPSEGIAYRLGQLTFSVGLLVAGVVLWSKGRA